MSGELQVVLDGQTAGTLVRDRNGRLHFSYDETYTDDPASTPLSLSMPLTTLDHFGRRLSAWLWNLLPDNELVLARWGAQFRVSPSSVFGLLEHVGRDVAGAVQFIDPDTDSAIGGGVDWLDEDAVEARLLELTRDPSAWTPAHDAGQFSLAGSQAKMALRLNSSGRWGEPWGAEPTTHILKPPMSGFAHQVLNEHLCLRTARRLNLPAAITAVRRFGDQQAIVVNRFDRLSKAGGVVRVHQEDLCQALGVPPSRKYQDQGGPGAVDAIDLFAAQLGPAGAVEPTERFIQALALSWVLAGTDAHAKNYSLLLAGDQVALAPLYDVNSTLPYQGSKRRETGARAIDASTARLAMNIGGRSRILEVDRDAWLTLADRASLDGNTVLELVHGIVTGAPTALGEIVTEEADAGVLDPQQQRFARALVESVARQSRLCGSALAGRPAIARRRPRPTTKQ